MTAQSSSKGCFVTYLKYRLGLLKINFVMCCILNVLGLPLYSIAANVGFGGGISEVAMTTRVFSTICIVALPVIAMFNAAASFDYYYKKDLTDTIGALPLSFKERFFADLLAGYAVNIVPLIPCGIACVIALGNTKEKLIRFHHVFPDDRFKMTDVGAIIVFALLVIITFAYLFTVLTSVCCGKVFHTGVFSLFGMAILPLLSYGLVRCFVNSVVGIDGSEYVLKGVAFFPPIGVLHDLFEAMGIAFQANLDWDNVLTNPAGKHFLVSEPVHIAVYVLLAAGLVALTYALAKRRLAENTGGAFAVKPAYYVLSAGITAGATIAVLAFCYNKSPYFLLAAVPAGALTFLMMLLLNPGRKKALLKSIITGAAALASILAVWLLIDKTGAFGVRYLPKDPDKVDYIKINNYYNIDNKEDIKTYITLLNERLRYNPTSMQFEDSRWAEPGFYVEVKTTDGKSVKRLYGGATTGRNIFSHLNGYVDYFFDDIVSAKYVDFCNVKSKNVNVQIPRDKLEEFITILREEASEKHSPDAAEFAEAVFYKRGEKTFIIEQSYTRTIEFLDSLNENTDVDPKEVYLSIDYTIRNGQWDSLTVNILYKDRDDARVKELVDLLKNGTGKRDGSFSVYSNYAAGLGDVTDKTRERVLEIMAELAAETIGG